jgi:class 3 adenylate cyclase
VAGRIQVSDAVVARLGTRYEFEERGSIEIKGIGRMQTYFLLGRAPQSEPLPQQLRAPLTDRLQPAVTRVTRDSRPAATR